MFHFDHFNNSALVSQVDLHDLQLCDTSSCCGFHTYILLKYTQKNSSFQFNKMWFNILQKLNVSSVLLVPPLVVHTHTQSSGPPPLCRSSTTGSPAEAALLLLPAGRCRLLPVCCLSAPQGRINPELLSRLHREGETSPVGAGGPNTQICSVWGGTEDVRGERRPLNVFIRRHSEEITQFTR